MEDRDHTPRPAVTFSSPPAAGRDWSRAGDQPEPVLFTLEEEAEQDQGQDPGSTSTGADNCGWLRDRLSRVYIRCGVGTVPGYVSTGVEWAQCRDMCLQVWSGHSAGIYLHQV